ncbi:DUF1275 domain-containing protein [Staphylococcus epidermidis]|nr:DUF1275 domain-containing protein [Staphylococcus epidermidis]
MGLQNATVTKMSSAQIRTTHMTGVITDLGMERDEPCTGIATAALLIVISMPTRPGSSCSPVCSACFCWAVFLCCGLQTSGLHLCGPARHRAVRSVAAAFVGRSHTPFTPHPLL